MHASDVLDQAGERRSDNNLRDFEAILLHELLPLVRKRYRVKSDPRSWAIGGLSLGGEFGMSVGLKHPEVFRTVASLSGSLVPTDRGEVGRSSFDVRFAPALAATHLRDYRLIWVSCGSEDIFLGGAKAFAAKLAAANIKHVFREFPGPHAMPVAPAATCGVAALTVSALNCIHPHWMEIQPSVNVARRYFLVARSPSRIWRRRII